MLPLKLQKYRAILGYDSKILLSNQFAGFFTFNLFDFLILIPWVHHYIELLLFIISLPVKNCFWIIIAMYHFPNIRHVNLFIGTVGTKYLIMDLVKLMEDSL